MARFFVMAVTEACEAGSIKKQKKTEFPVIYAVNRDLKCKFEKK
jgi:hypothetical protein